jgi:hypothetical protein
MACLGGVAVALTDTSVSTKPPHTRVKVPRRQTNLHLPSPPSDSNGTIAGLMGPAGRLGACVWHSPVPEKRTNQRFCVGYPAKVVLCRPPRGVFGGNLPRGRKDSPHQAPERACMTQMAWAVVVCKLTLVVAVLVLARPGKAGPSPGTQVGHLCNAAAPPLSTIHPTPHPLPFSNPTALGTPRHMLPCIV